MKPKIAENKTHDHLNRTHCIRASNGAICCCPNGKVCSGCA